MCKANSRDLYEPITNHPWLKFSEKVDPFHPEITRVTMERKNTPTFDIFGQTYVGIYKNECEIAKRRHFISHGDSQMYLAISKDTHTHST